MKIPFNIPYVAEASEAYMLEALRSRAHCGNRGFGERAIAKLEEIYGLGEVFLTPSCTAALEMGALLADLQPGDEVILPSYTFSSTANAVVLRGARPVFCDVDPRTMNLDPELIEPLLTERTRMIAPIDYAGIPCEIERILEIASKHDLVVLQDAAQSNHSRHHGGKYCGAAAPLAAYSFHESKNLNCGEGGALVVNDPELVERAHFLQEKGTDRSLVVRGVKSKYCWVDLGSSFLLSDILAALLLAQIEEAESLVARRARVTAAYRRLFAPYEDAGQLQTPQPPPGVELNHHAFFVIFDRPENQQRFLDDLRTKQIYAYIGYVPLHSSPMGRRFGYQPQDVPRTEEIAQRIVRLPFYAELEGPSLDYCLEGMGETLRSIYGS
jgi:dTDP-4-amino-4,6-dideoxygalactose transaminase